MTDLFASAPPPPPPARLPHPPQRPITPPPAAIATAPAVYMVPSPGSTERPRWALDVAHTRLASRWRQWGVRGAFSLYACPRGVTLRDAVLIGRYDGDELADPHPEAPREVVVDTPDGSVVAGRGVIRDGVQTYVASETSWRSLRDRIRATAESIRGRSFDAWVAATGAGR